MIYRILLRNTDSDDSVPVFIEPWGTEVDIPPRTNYWLECENPEEGAEILSIHLDNNGPGISLYPNGETNNRVISFAETGEMIVHWTEF